MSDLGLRAAWTPVKSQLPVSAYFDEALFQREVDWVLRNGPRYVGHELMVPERGDYFALPHEGEGRVLVHGPAGIDVLSNVCRHRQAIMLNGRGNTESIVCPLHRWTYDLQGRLLGAPHFAEQPCVQLERAKNLQNWRGLLFEGPRDIAQSLAGMVAADDFNFDGHKLDHVEIHECSYNWKTFI